MSSDDDKSQRPIRLREREKLPRADPIPPHRLMAIVRFLAEHTERVVLGDHAQERMEERSITSEDVYFALRKGEIVGRIVAGRAPKEWKCKVVARPRGSRKMGVVTIVVSDEYLFVKTVEWEDR